MSHPMIVPARVRRVGPVVRLALVAARALARVNPARLERIMRGLSARTAPADTGCLERYYDSLCRADPRVAGLRGCLPRSIAVCLLARLRGTWPDSWCAGIHRYPPFSAHAWVENADLIVRQNEAPDDYRPLLRADRI